MKLRVIILSLVVITWILPVFAASNNKIKGNKFVSLGASEAHVRAGPAKKFPIKWTYNIRALPLEIINYYGDWRKIIDENGQSGWIYRSLLDKKRRFSVRSYTSLYRNPKYKNSVIVALNKKVRGDILSCRASWCRVKVDKYIGWVKKNDIWGVYPEEIIN